MKPITYQSIGEKYQGKVVGVIGQETILGRIMIKKLLHQLRGVEKIILINTSNRKIQKEEQLKEIFYQDPYFSDLDLEKLERILHIDEQINTDSGERIDILFNCHIPMDYTKKGIQACLDSHFWKTKKICEFLRKFYIGKFVLVSSIYCENSGIVSQSINNHEKNLISYNPSQISKSNFLQNLKEIFKEDLEIWKWSVAYMQYLYAQDSKAETTHIVRVPLLGPTLLTHEDIYEGYITNFNSLTSLIYQIGNGFIDAIQGISDNIIDMIPADFPVNFMIVIAVTEEPVEFVESSSLQNEEQQKYHINFYNLSTSSRNPVKLGDFVQYVIRGWTEYSQKPMKLKFGIQQKKWQRKMYLLKNNFPKQVKNRLAVLFDIKPWQIQSQQDKIESLKKKSIMKKYRFFFEREWICESNKSIDYYNSLSPEDQKLFRFNVNEINWKIYGGLCCYSIKKYLLGMDVEKFTPRNLDLLHLSNQAYFSDVLWAFTEGKSILAQDYREIKRYVLSTKSVKDAIKQLVEQQQTKLEQGPTSYQRVEKQYYKAAEQICDQMFSQYNMGSIRVFAWFLHKVFRTIYEKVVIDKKSMGVLRNHDEKSGPLIVIPTHRSYVDFLIMSYVFFGYGIKVPHIAAAQDFLNMAIVHVLLRKSGAFFIKRNQQKNKELYKAIMNEYISKLLSEKHYLEFFVEGTRSRVGKMLAPKFGILSIVAKNVLEGKIPDALVLPVTINYEKVLEGESFTYEMMGQSKVKESLQRLLKAADVLKENYGRIYIELCEPISVKKYFATVMPKFQGRKDQYEQTLNLLGHQIVYDLSDNLVVTPPAIVSTILLMHRIGISDDRLSEKVNWLCKQIVSRNIKIARHQADQSISIPNTVSLLQEIITKSKKDMFEVQLSFDQSSFTQLFTLTYYRNTLTHIFFHEAIVAVAMGSFGHQNIIQPKITLNRLWTQSLYLATLLKNQFVLKEAFNESRFEEIIHLMESKKLISINADGTFTVLHPDSNLFSLYCSLVWPVVESYWVSCLYLFKLSKDNSVLELDKLQKEIQWFAQSLIMERITLYLESISIDTIRNACTTLKGLKIMKEVKEAGRKVVKMVESQEKLKSVESKISEFLKSKYAGSIKGIINSGRGSVNLDFPFLSKI